MKTRRGWLVAGMMVVQAWTGLAVRADDFVDRVNKGYSTIRSDLRSDVILMPLVAAMAPTPGPVSSTWQAMLLPPGTSAWPAAEAWATGAPQKAVIDALRKATKERDPARGFGFGMPYGDQAVAGMAGGITLIDKDLFTDLGDPPLLAGARFGHLEGLKQVASLVNVEATRLLAAGEAKNAILLMIDWLYLNRQLAERAFFAEKVFAFEHMTMALERIRDLAYQDWRTPAPKLTQAEIQEFLEVLRDETRLLAIDRIEFPTGDKVAAEQIIARCFVERGKANPPTFAETMARQGSSNRPLRLFSESSKWTLAAAAQADWFDTKAQLDKIYGDWTSRWSLNPFDSRLSLKSDYEQTDANRFTALRSTLGDMSVLFNARQVLRAHYVGARSALALVAFNKANRTLAPQIESVTPKFIKAVEADPFNPDRAAGRRPPLEYFVPIRDQVFGAKEDKRPHTLSVFTPDPGVNFKIDLGQDQFVLYSRGPDGAKNWATTVTMQPARAFPGDMLLWPPVVSLSRQELVRTGGIK
jgi:hypothetical protein